MCFAFFSRKLTPVEINYDVGNRELLSMKAALEEWRHWLEEANHPFLIIIDHHNLAYIREAKRLNRRQARWSSFFSRFKFSVTYRPDSENGKADALSRLLDTTDRPTYPDPILPSSVLIAPVQWSIHREIEQA